MTDRRHILFDPNYQRCFFPAANLWHTGWPPLCAAESCFSSLLFSSQSYDGCQSSASQNVSELFAVSLAIFIFILTSGSDSVPLVL